MPNSQDNRRLSSLETKVDVLANDVSYIKSDLTKVVDFVDSNRSGITMASLLNTRITTVVIGGIIAAGIYFLSKGGL